MVGKSRCETWQGSSSRRSTNSTSGSSKGLPASAPVADFRDPVREQPNTPKSALPMRAVLLCFLAKTALGRHDHRLGSRWSFSSFYFLGKLQGVVHLNPKLTKLCFSSLVCRGRAELLEACQPNRLRGPSCQNRWNRIRPQRQERKTATSASGGKTAVTPPPSVTRQCNGLNSEP